MNEALAAINASNDALAAANTLAAGKFQVRVKITVPERLKSELEDATNRRTARDALRELLDDLEPALGATADVPRDEDDAPIYAIEQNGCELTAILTMTPEEDTRERVAVEVCIMAPDGAKMRLADSTMESSVPDKISEFLDGLGTLFSPVDVREMHRNDGGVRQPYKSVPDGLTVNTVMLLRPVKAVRHDWDEIEAGRESVPSAAVE